MKIFDQILSFFGFSEQEKRAAQRLKIFEAVYLDWKDSAGKEGKGEGKDISTSGIRFASDIEFPKGTILDLKLRFAPGSIQKEMLEVKAQVIRCYKPKGGRHYRVGCIFKNLDPEAQGVLKSLIGWLKEREKKYLFFRYQ